MNKWFSKSLDDVKAQFDTKVGLNNQQVEQSRTENGENKLKEAKGESLLSRLVNQFKDPTIIILLVAAVISGFTGELTDTIIIIAIVAINAYVSIVQEDKAQKALKALQDMTTPIAKVIRNGKEISINSHELVVGDLIVLEAGDLVPADIRIIESSSLKIQEASLTGESVPVEKTANLVCSEDALLGDRKNMAYSSGMVSYGRGTGIVVAVGMSTEVGKIAEMLSSTQCDPTPLQLKLNQLGKVLGIGALVACALIFVIGMIRQHEFMEMFMMAVSLAVAVVPESLPAVSVIVLAFGVQKLVNQNAIVRNLPSVETLGGATVICSDKTGTLTQNVMTVKQHWTKDSSIENLALGSLLCNDSRYLDGKWVGDPTETALSVWALENNYSENLIVEYARVNEVPFDSGRKRMSTINNINDKLVVFTKGGVDEILAVSTHYMLDGKELPLTPEFISEIQAVNKEMGVKALRVLAIARKNVETKELSETEIEGNLTFVGLVGMIDPPRPEVAEAIRVSKKAGIRVVMITGDHSTTAEAIGKEIGLFEEGQKVVTGKELDNMTDDDLFNEVKEIAVYARVSPEHKMRIISAWKRHGEVVAMTGDGVNDAPALKRADIGAAMGIVGTEVAKGAADMILTDDNFATVVVAIREGRRIKDNIIKSVLYLLSCNVGEMFLPLVAIILGWENPLLAIHLLWINLVTDSLPALALGVDPEEPGIMDRQPERSSALITKPMFWKIAYQGITIGTGALLAFMYGSGFFGVEGSHELGRTMAFIVLGFSQLVHSYSIHAGRKSVFTTAFKNKWLLLATAANAVMVLAVVFIKPVSVLFKLVPIDVNHWIVIILCALLPLVVVETMKLLKLNGDKQ